jgi:hypothetical protein
MIEEEILVKYGKRKHLKTGENLLINRRKNSSKTWEGNPPKKQEDWVG